MIRNLYTYIHTYIHTEKEKKKKKKSERNTTLSIYNSTNFLKFKQILEMNDDNVSSFLDDTMMIILEQYDLKEHSLDKFLEDMEAVLPNINSSPENVLAYLQKQPIEKVKQYEAFFQMSYIYTLAITNGETEMKDYPYLWRKYKHR